MKLKNALILLLTATIWGVAFVAQSVGGSVGTFTFNATRSILGFLFLLIVILIQKIKITKQSIIGGIGCGICLFIAMTLQQYGVVLSTVGKAGFITAFYILLVPILGLVIGKRLNKQIIIGILLAIIGLYFLCINEKLTIEIGDLLLLGCALFYAIHILVIDHFVVSCDAIVMSCIQFLMVAVVSMICMLLFEDPQIEAIFDSWLPIVYAGVFSSGIAYTLQMIGQKGMDPTISSLILSLESSISVLAGMILLHSMLSLREAIGCLFMFSAIMIAQK